MSVAGIPISEDECARRWRPWNPDELAERLGAVAAPWVVVGGWAIDLFLGRVTRHHDDIEIAVPADYFEFVAAALPGYEWDVVGAGQLWPYPEALGEFRQTWLRDAASGSFLLDVFRERHDAATWSFRRDPTITLPDAAAYSRTPGGVPYLVPELALMFKARDVRPKDQQDFDEVLPQLGEQCRARLRAWLRRTEPGHRWLNAL